jgi:hypothetical protein
MLTGCSDNAARLWDAESGGEIHRFEGHSRKVDSVAFSSDGRFVLTGSWDGTTRLWEVESGREIRRFEGRLSALSADGRHVLTGNGDAALLWEAETGKRIRQFYVPSESVLALALSPDEKYLVTLSEKCLLFGPCTARLWGLDSGKELRRKEEGYLGILSTSSIAFSPDGRYVLTKSEDNTARLWRSRTGQDVWRFTGDSPIVSVGFSPDGKYAMTGSDDGTTGVWDVETGEEVRRFDGHSGQISSLAFSGDGKLVMTGGAQTKIWDASGNEMCTLVSFDSGAWAVVDPDGRFDASEGGDVQGLHWVVGNESIDLYQLKDRYYEPGLLAKVLHYQPLRPVEAFKQVKFYPAVELKRDAHSPDLADVTLTNRGGGIGQVEVYVGGKLMEADARGFDADRKASKASLELRINLDQYKRFMVPGEANDIEVVSHNAEGYLASRGVHLVYTPPKEAPVEPHFWALVAGVSQYREGGDLRSLNFAAKDAEAISKALGVAALQLFPGKVDIKVPATSLSGADQKPTKENIAAALTDVAGKAQATDVFVLYLAGHGVSYGGENGDYYFLTSDASTGDLKDPAIRESTAISSEELAKMVIDIPAKKQVVILDTCASGRLAERLSESRNVDSSVIRAWDRMKDHTGVWILAGCAADASSYESSRYGQGVLTYSLLEGMKQDWDRALRKDEKSGIPEYLDVSRLFNFAADRVPLLAEGIGGIQRPLIAARRDARSFDFGRITPADRQFIPLASKKPVFLTTRIDLEVRPSDPLGLTSRLNDRLRDASTRGLDSTLVFWDVDEHPGAYKIAGRYQVSGTRVTVKVFVCEFVQQKDQFEEKDLGAPVTVTGNTSSPAGLEKLTSEILEAAEKAIASRRQ